MKHVIFGTGPLGQSVMRELLRRGQSVRMVNRSGEADVPDAVEVVASDAYNPENARGVCAGADVVYQCAQPAYTEWPEKFPPLQASILEGATANQAKFIVADNLYMYGDTNGQPIHEALPYVTHTKKGKVRAAMAEAVLEAHQTGKVRAAIARGSDFYGVGVKGSVMGERIFEPILQGKSAQVLGNPDLPHTYTVIDDFGKALVILGEQESALGQVWHVPNPPTITTRELVTQAFEMAGQAPKFMIVNKMMLRMVGLFVPEVREAVELAYEFQKPFIVVHSKFERAFGNHATPHDEALRQTLDWYQAEMAVLA